MSNKLEYLGYNTGTQKLQVLLKKNKSSFVSVYDKRDLVKKKLQVFAPITPFLFVPLYTKFGQINFFGQQGPFYQKRTHLG